LEGHGPVGASLPMRAAALIAADGELDRIEARERVEDTLELERSTMNGRSMDGAIGVATWAEEGVRRLLRAAALGELGNDLSATADENLIVAGLAEGDAEITVSIQEPEPDPEPQLELAEPTASELRIPEPELREEDEYDVEQETRIMEPIPA